MESINDFNFERGGFNPPLPDILNHIETIEAFFGEQSLSLHALQELFPKMEQQSLIYFRSQNRSKHSPYRLGVVFSGGQAPGGHNVIIGLFDAIKKLHSESSLFGFLGGPSGIIENRFRELKYDELSRFRNTGGFDLIGSGRTKIETAPQFDAIFQNCQNLRLDGLVIIGGDDSNTNAAFLAHYFISKGGVTRIIGVPKTIDGDLKNDFIECSFGFDTACKIYSEMIGNICRDAKSAQKYSHFIKLMGRSASHITLECALQTHPNLALIGEEIAQKNWKLQDLIKMISQVILERAKAGKNYNVILIPEGLIEFIPEMKLLIQELNTLLAQDPQDALSKLSEPARRTFTFLPKKIVEQLLLDRDPHGNVQVSHIATEELLIELIKKELVKHENFRGKFAPLAHFLGYEGRCGYPSNFDATYCYALGFTAAALVATGCQGYISALKNLDQPAHKWIPLGVPLISMMGIEERKGEKKAVIKKALVNLESPPFKEFSKERALWAAQDCYCFPGPIQFYGPSHICDTRALTLQLESKAGLTF